jgi:hypothetical protein
MDGLVEGDMSHPKFGMTHAFGFLSPDFADLSELVSIYFANTDGIVSGYE